MRSKLSTIVLALLLGALIVTACGPLAAGEKVEVPAQVLQARETALAFVRGRHGEQEPPPDLVWKEENITPGWPDKPVVGWSEYRFTSDDGAGDWVVTVGHPVLPLEQTLYKVMVANRATGFHWSGTVDAAGQVADAAEPAPDVGGAELRELAGGNNAFAFDLYRALREEEGNLFYSPYSISQALAMTYAGARGQTEQEMADTLHFRLPQERLHPAFSALDLVLAGRGEGAEGMDGQGFRLNIVNALWGQDGYPFLPEFLNLLARNYGAGLRRLDFAANAEAARQTINDWVSGQTEGRIEDLIPQGVLDATTRLVLTNAIYFNAAWSHPFEPHMTVDGPFYPLDGGELMVPMMRQTEPLGYVQGEGYQAVELPYDGHELSMVILLPDAGGFDSFEGAMDAEGVATTLEELEVQDVRLTMPKFEFDSAFSLNRTLESMGMPLAFSGEADFTGMTGDRDLFISAVLHKAFVAVDEAGTEAAAATAVAMAEMAMEPGPEPVEVTVDRPFVFLIRDIETGSILFVGRVVDLSG